MILPDVNVLIYAFRADSPGHRKCLLRLESVVRGDMAYGKSPQVLGAVVRIVTHPRIFVPPAPLDEALAFANLLVDQPHCQVIQPGPRHWGIFRDACRRARGSGNLVQDAGFAALAIESGREWITTDRDYGRFEGLRWSALF